MPSGSWTRATSAPSPNRRRPDRRRVKGKNLFIISCYQLLDSCKIPSEAAQAAGKSMGWKTTIVDGGLDAGKESDGIKQAISAHADAIILAGVDCAPVQASMQQARQAGIKVVGLYSFDCDDKSIANAGAPLFDYIQRVGELGSADAAISYGNIKAAYAIAKLQGKVVAIDTTSPNHTVLQYVSKGFRQEMARCKTCKIATTVSFTDEDVLSGKLKDTLVTTLQSYPKTNTIQVAIDPVFQIAVSPALANKPNIITLGGEGVPANMDLIRSGKETMAMAVPHEWAGYLGVDAVNRLLAGEKPAQIPNEGFGYQIIDKDHNIPPTGPYLPLNMKTQKPVELQGRVPQGLGRPVTAVEPDERRSFRLPAGMRHSACGRVSKTYGLAKALDDISFEMIRGKVARAARRQRVRQVDAHQDPGRRRHRGLRWPRRSIGEERIEAASMTPDHARDLGLRFVHQDLGVFTDLTVAENMAIGAGFPTGPMGNIRWKQVERNTASCSTGTTSVLGPTRCCTTSARLTGRWWPSLGRCRTPATTGR